MRSSTEIDRVWKSRKYIGADRPCTRVTVEPDYLLHKTGQTYGGSHHGPYRWFQRADNSQVEVEIPNVKSVNWDRSTDQAVATCTIEIYNQKMIAVDTEDPLPGVLGDPGHYFAEHGVSPESQAMWGHVANEWEGVLTPNALIRTYQGYGGHDKTLDDAITDGNLLITGTWLVDEVAAGADGILRLTLRDMGKLLTDQQLYPPLIPKKKYPLRFCRYNYVNRRIRNRERIEDGVNVTPVVSAGAPISVTVNPNAAGYWELRNNGQVFGFGDARREKINTSTPNHAAPNYGGAASNVNAIALNGIPSGNGYWVMHSNGRMLAYGDAIWYGDLMDGGGGNARDFAPTPSGLGYWILEQNGTVTAYGDAGSYGGVSVSGGNYAQSIESHPTIATGYWIMKEEGGVTAKGTLSTYAIQPLQGGGTPSGTAPYGVEFTGPEYFTAMRSTSTGNGYWLVSGSGKVRAFGDANHYGEDPRADLDRWAANLYWDIIPYLQTDGGYALPGSFDDFKEFGPEWDPYGSIEQESQVLRKDGNYKDYSNIVSRLLRWSGWVLYETAPPSDEYAHVYGSIETTGAFSKECLPDDMFDKKPVIDAITQIKEVVGYHFYINEEGAAQFKTPNWWAPGNFDENGEYVATIPDLSDALNVTSYASVSNDTSLRSEIIIATEDPTAGLRATKSTRFYPFSADLLKGMCKPAMWVNGIFQDKEEQLVMAELIALHVWFSKRVGSVTLAANPNIQIDDQVRVYERVSSDTFIHYVRGQSMSHDLDSGVFTMTLNTHWLGDQEDWSTTSLGTTRPPQPEEKCPPSSLKLVTYPSGVSSTTDITYGHNGLVHGHRPSNAFDVNPNSFWLSMGHNSPSAASSFEWLEMDCHGEDINQIYIRPWKGNYMAYISVYENGRWVRGDEIPYTPGDYTGDNTAAIPYVKRYGLPIAHNHVGDGVAGWKWHMLPRSYKADKIRVTLTNLYRSQWGPKLYRAGIVTLQAAQCDHLRIGGVTYDNYQGPQSNAVNRGGASDRRVELTPTTIAAVKKFGSARVRDL